MESLPQFQSFKSMTGNVAWHLQLPAVIHEI
jgi:hypothetical protein